MLAKYAADHGFTNIRFYVDDGVSGTLFSRPGLNAMLEDVTNNRVAIVIFKDQSRIGRDVVEVGLLKRTFDEHNVRFIAAADGLDSINGFDIMSTFRDVINEYYVAESSKKVRAAKRTGALQGKALGKTPYGYKVGDDKSEWIIDEYEADVVREIFKKVIAGDSYVSIARGFTERGILPPNVYRRRQKGIVGDYNEEWHLTAISQLVDNPVYMGRYTAGKHTTPSYKNRTRVNLPEDEWIVIENHHPPIVSVEIFETAKRLRNARRRITKNNEKGLLSGLIFCADCNSKLSMVTFKPYATYICSNYRTRGLWRDHSCTRHAVRKSEIEEIALTKIRETVALAIRNKDRFIKRVNKNTNKDTEKAIKVKTAELAKTQKRVAELDNIISRIYEDHVAGKLSAERFDKMLGGYEAKQSKLTALLAALQGEIATLESKAVNVQSFINLAERHGEITELTDTVAREFIERIVVHEAVRENPNFSGSPKTQEIHVFLSYIGEFE
jgi:DNA invertase Pin-like site-specific DNA recombinase